MSQKRHRLYLFGEQLKNKPRNLTGRQKFVAYCPGFPNLKNNPQLLGATKLLQGMYDKEALEAYLAMKNARPEMDEISLSSSQFRVARKKSFVDTIMHRVLDVPATKVTSIMLMNRDRSRYVKQWQEQHSPDDTEVYPPLYRWLEVEETDEGDIEEDDNEEDDEEEEFSPLVAQPEIVKATSFSSFLPSFARKEVPSTQSSWTVS